VFKAVFFTLIFYLDLKHCPFRRDDITITICRHVLFICYVLNYPRVPLLSILSNLLRPLMLQNLISVAFNFYGVLFYFSVQFSVQFSPCKTARSATALWVQCHLIPLPFQPAVTWKQIRPDQTMSDYRSHKQKTGTAVSLSPKQSVQAAGETSVIPHLCQYERVFHCTDDIPTAKRETCTSFYSFRKWGMDKTVAILRT
jgi:hypothetical protein